MPTPAVFLTFCLLGTAAAAQPASPSHRAIEVTAEAGGVEPEVLISTGKSTTFLFDAELLRTSEGHDTVDLRERTAFTLVDVGQATLRLVPGATLEPGRRLRLLVHFKDGAAPASAAFTLVVHPDTAERQVEVYRQARPVDSYKQEAAETRTRAARCEAELARARAERGGPGGLAALLATGEVDGEGVTAKEVLRALTQGPGSAVTPWRAVSYRMARRVVVLVALSTPPGAPPWTAGGAALVGRRGEELQVLSVWQSGPATDDAYRRALLVVDVAAEPGQAQGTYTLKLWDAGTKRNATFGNVSFPSASGESHKN